MNNGWQVISKEMAKNLGMIRYHSSSFLGTIVYGFLKKLFKRSLLYKLNISFSVISFLLNSISLFFSSIFFTISSYVFSNFINKLINNVKWQNETLINVNNTIANSTLKQTNITLLNKSYVVVGVG